MNKVYLCRGNLRGGRATLREVILPIRKMEQSECGSAWFPWWQKGRCSVSKTGYLSRDGVRPGGESCDK